MEATSNAAPRVDRRSDKPAKTVLRQLPVTTYPGWKWLILVYVG
jgi:hypothetical protein